MCNCLSHYTLKQQIRTRLDLLRPDINSKIVHKQVGQKKSYDEHSRKQTFFTGQTVTAINYRAGLVWMPGTFVKKNGPLIKINGDHLWKRHIDQLKE